MFRLPLKKASQHGSTGLSAVLLSALYISLELKVAAQISSIAGLVIRSKESMKMTAKMMFVLQGRRMKLSQQLYRSLIGTELQ